MHQKPFEKRARATGRDQKIEKFLFEQQNEYAPMRSNNYSVKSSTVRYQNSVLFFLAKNLQKYAILVVDMLEPDLAKVLDFSHTFFRIFATSVVCMISTLNFLESFLLISLLGARI